MTPKGILNDSEMVESFLKSREAMHVTNGTLEFYRKKLNRTLKFVDLISAGREDIESFLAGIKNPGNRHAYFRTLRTFYAWREDNYSLPSPMKKMKPPIVPKKILPRLTREQVMILIATSVSPRDKAIIALFADTGLRLGELANIKESDIDWERRIIRVSIKGQREEYAVFGEETEKYLRHWLKVLPAEGGYIWDLNYWGISTMLKRLHEKTGLPCNAHVFRRTFACILKENGASTLIIKELGRWRTTQMVEHYTRNVGFFESLKFYRAPVSPGDRPPSAA